MNEIRHLYGSFGWLECIIRTPFTKDIMYQRALGEINRIKYLLVACHVAGISRRFKRVMHHCSLTKSSTRSHANDYRSWIMDAPTAKTT